MVEQSRKHPLGCGGRECPVSAVRIELASDCLDFHSAAQWASHPRNPRGGHCFAESIRSQETEEAACLPSLPCGSLQHSVGSRIKSETRLVFCFQCFLVSIVSSWGFSFTASVACREMCFLFLASVFVWCELFMGNWKEKGTLLWVGRSKLWVGEGKDRHRKGEKSCWFHKYKTRVLCHHNARDRKEAGPRGEPNTSGCCRAPRPSQLSPFSQCYKCLVGGTYLQTLMVCSLRCMFL